jgi:hypothetical protein
MSRSHSTETRRCREWGGEARRVAWGSICHGKAGVQLAVHAAALALLEVAPICLMLVPLVGLGNLWPSSVGNDFFVCLDCPWNVDTQLCNVESRTERREECGVSLPMEC